MPFSEKQLDDIFVYHDDPSKVEKYVAVREAAKAFAKVLVANTPPSADQTTAVRKVREAVMTANAAIALDGKF